MAVTNNASDLGFEASLFEAASIEDIRARGHVLTPGRYVGTEAAEEDDTPFTECFATLQEQLEAQFAEAEELTATIRARLGAVLPQ